MPRWRVPSIVASLLLAACTLISGANELSAIDAPEAGADSNVEDADTTVDSAIPPDVAADVSVFCTAPNLRARWKLDEGNGTSINDCTENAINGVFAPDAGGIAWVPGKSGSALALDGGWVGFGDPPKLRITGEITITAWVMPAANAPPGASQYIVGKTKDISKAGWRLAVVSRTEVFMSISNGDAAINAQGGNLSLDGGAWTHVAGVFRPGMAVEAYAAGQIVANTTAGVPTTSLDKNDEVRIGIRGDGALPFVGFVDDIRVYDRAFSAAEIQQLAAE